MNDVVLVITSSHDSTCDYLISKYKEINFFRMNMDMFSTYKISISSDGFLLQNQYREVSSKNCKSIYFRKPIGEDLSRVYDEKYHQFSYREAYSVIEGLVEYFPGKCLSKPSIMRRSGNKVFQALTAHEVGFRIPTLSITNSIESVESISRNKSIVKPLSVGEIIDQKYKEYVQTNLYNEKYDLSLLKYTPAYFQHYIQKDYEVRITFVGKKSFSVKIESENSVDWRKLGNKITYTIFDIPENIYENCLLYLKKTKMEFGCFDFIVHQDEWYFLEMNSNGQWAWLEFETGLQISKKIMEYLND